MKLFQEFKSINHEPHKPKILLAENEDIYVLKKIAAGFVAKDGHDIDLLWTHLRDSPTAAHIMQVNDEYEMVIRP